MMQIYARICAKYAPVSSKKKSTNRCICIGCKTAGTAHSVCTAHSSRTAYTAHTAHSLRIAHTEIVDTVGKKCE